MTKFYACGNEYRLEQVDENSYALISNGEYATSIIICKIEVTCPDGITRQRYAYNPKIAGGAADIAVADCAVEYLEGL